MKTTNTKYHKAGNTWRETDRTNRANWLESEKCSTLWADYSWTHLPESVRLDFISHFTFCAEYGPKVKT